MRTLRKGKKDKKAKKRKHLFLLKSKVQEDRRKIGHTKNGIEWLPIKIKEITLRGIILCKEYSLEYKLRTENKVFVIKFVGGSPEKDRFAEIFSKIKNSLLETD